ncbi:BT1A1 protein, partial [Polypterus senegalus]|nr:BT1A1 protein [Polypterus senegalus]
MFGVRVCFGCGCAWSGDGVGGKVKGDKSLADFQLITARELLCYVRHPNPESERFQVVGPFSAVLVHVGEDVTLPASLSPVISAQRFEVRWFRDDFDSPVLLYQNHQIKPERQMQAYNGRAALFTEELQNGNVSLRLQDIRVSDGGLYRCFVDSGPWNEEVHITLNVEALGGQPFISISSTEDQQARLECKADKWGTTPDVAWGDMNGVHLTSESSVTEKRDNEGFLRVSSFIPIKQEFNMFSCLMRSKVPKPDWHSGLTVYSEYSELWPPCLTNI